jgi:hypothetical protein
MHHNINSAKSSTYHEANTGQEHALAIKSSTTLPFLLLVLLTVA